MYWSAHHHTDTPSTSLKYLSPMEVSDQLINWYTAKGGEGKTRVSIPKFAGAELAAKGNKRKDKLFSSDSRPLASSTRC